MYSFARSAVVPPYIERYNCYDGQKEYYVKIRERGQPEKQTTSETDIQRKIPENAEAQSPEECSFHLSYCHMYYVIPFPQPTARPELLFRRDLLIALLRWRSVLRQLDLPNRQKGLQLLSRRLRLRSGSGFDMFMIFCDSDIVKPCSTRLSSSNLWIPSLRRLASFAALRENSKPSTQSQKFKGSSNYFFVIGSNLKTFKLNSKNSIIVGHQVRG